MMTAQNRNPYRDEVILIGPVASGKSTVGRLIAQRLGLPEVAMESVRYHYYAEIGHDDDYAAALRADGRYRELFAYWRPFEIHATRATPRGAS